MSQPHVTSPTDATKPKPKAGNRNLHIVAGTQNLRATYEPRRGLNENELQSLYALFDWFAIQQALDVTAVKALTEASMGVNDITKLPPSKYDEAIRLLVDLHDVCTMH